MPSRDYEVYILEIYFVMSLAEMNIFPIRH
jgi:hypothetical protein